MKTTTYLYDCEPSEFADMPYKKALQFKINKTKELVTKLLIIPYKKRDNYRVNHVLEAQSFNEKLIKELEEINYEKK